MTPVDRMLASLDDEQNLDAWERNKKRLRDIMEDLPDDMPFCTKQDIAFLMRVFSSRIKHYKQKMGMI